MHKSSSPTLSYWTSKITSDFWYRTDQFPIEKAETCFYVLILGTLPIEFALNNVIFQKPHEGDPKHVMSEMARDFLDTKAAGIPLDDMPQCFYYYLVGVRDVIVKRARVGSLRVTVECKTLEILESLWEDYCSGNLNAAAEARLLTDDIKNRFHVVSVKLQTTILEEDYLACKLFLTNISREGYTVVCSLYF